MAKGMFAALKGVDAFGKTSNDVKIKTRTGAFLTIVSAAIIFTFTLMEFLDYRQVNINTSLVVDRSRGEKLIVRFNMTYPRVPCYLLSLDVMDISGDNQRDIAHNVWKVRLDQSLKEIPGSHNPTLKNEVDKLHEERSGDYCGSCYGGLMPASGCCNSCEDVRVAYLSLGWAFSDPDSIEQCRREGWLENLKDQANEGCNVYGMVRVNKVAGSLHFSPGRSFQTQNRDVYELVPYLRNDNQRHDFSHFIHRLTFEGDDEFDYMKAHISRTMKERLGLGVNPLDGTNALTNKAEYMWQYFLKVVSTQFRTLDGKMANSHQYSTTSFERDLKEGSEMDTPQGIHVSHNNIGAPGAFFNYEISPILVVHSDSRQSFAHFLTSTCAIVGGVLTVASLVDSVAFATGRVLKKK